MASHEESSFLEAVESRLDSIFGTDSKPVRRTDPDSVQETPTGEGLRDDSVFSQTGKLPPDPAPAGDRSAFLSEIDKRFDAIFGEEASPAQAESDDWKEPAAGTRRGESEKEENLSEDLTLFSSALPDFPLKNLQKIVVSLETRMSDSGLERLDEEVRRLDRVYEDDPICQGLLRILRFAGRYVRVKGTRSGSDALQLLFSVYSRLELIAGGVEMAQETRRHFLKESIAQYQSWVESADLEKRFESEVPEGLTDGERGRETEPSGDRPRKNALMEEMPVARIRVVEDKTPSAGSRDALRLAEAMKDLPPHEAYALALAEMKKSFQDEIAVLKEEIRLLKAKGHKSI
ncbi:MAG TPA: hypothetical protein P5208_09470 [Smithellaceae bacterium]|nr:hypothetical protein [Smithellaceae bacterium]